MTQIAQACMSMYDFDLLSNNNIPKDWEEGEEGWKGSCAVDDEKWYVVDLETVREISHTGSSFIGVSYNYDFVSSIDKLGGELVDVTLYTTWLRKEKIANHCDIVGHLRGDIEGRAIDQLAGTMG
jgi:hypothetical protein